MSDTMHYLVGIGFGLLAIGVALAASLQTPLVVLDKTVVGGLLVGGFAVGGVTVGTSTVTRALRAATRP